MWMQELVNAALVLLQQSPVGEIVRSSQYLYAGLEAGHVFGIALLIGPAFAFDLRLLGFGAAFVPVSKAGRHLLPIAHIGLAVAVLTGIGLLSAQATMIAAAGAAPWKVGLLLFACANVLVSCPRNHLHRTPIRPS
jgi:hypothetical protein